MSEPLKRYRNLMYDSLRWDGFRFRDDDIVISTPAKCDTTWMQMICALLIFQDPVLPRPLTALSPWLDIQTAPLEEVTSALEAQNHRRFIKTHTPLDGIPFDERVTYIGVGRDPRDVALSWDNHAANMNLDAVLGARVAASGSEDLAELLGDGPPPVLDDPVERFWAWVDADLEPLGGRPCLAATLHHLDTCWVRRHHDNVALFHFGDLQADLDAEMRRLAAVLGIRVPDRTWPSLVSAATFERMRARADELAPQVGVADFWHDTSRFFHRGGSGQWRAIISDEELPRYEARVRQLAPPDLDRWAHLGWRGADGPD
jgi:aryl sulfotransferase